MASYVTTDLHGVYDRFRVALDRLTPDDHLYILGDVIDRGPRGISILIECLNNPQITLLMGNHEWMMLKVLDEIADDDYVYKHHVSQHYERWQRNGCGVTLKEFHGLDLHEKKMLHQYLKTLPLAIANLNISSNYYYLVHGFPSDENLVGPVFCHDVANESEIEAFVWKRIMEHKIFVPNQTVLFGHTMTPLYQDSRPYEIWENQGLIGLDCGLAQDHDDSRLALYNLDLKQVEYF